jgi:glutaredoxin 2
MKNPAAVALGKLGGKAGTGQAKARTSEQARAAVNARWAKRKPKRWRELAANMTETPGYHEQVDDLSSLHKLLKAIKKLGYHAHSAKQKAGKWLVWVTGK